jgi:hypothetical protein
MDGAIVTSHLTVHRPEDATIVLTVQVTQTPHWTGQSAYGFPWTITWKDGTQTPVRQIGKELNELGREFAERVSKLFVDQIKRSR